MAGARTIDSYKVTMGPGGPSFRRKRIRNGLSEYNLRIVVSGLASVNPCAEIFKHRFSPIVLITTAKAPLSRRTACRAAGAEIEICGESEIDFEMAMRRLRQRWGVRHLLCEGGGQLNQALLTAGLVNEIHQTICPLLLGGRAAPTLADGAGISNLKEAVQLRLKSWRRCHDELFLVHAVQPRVTPASVSAVATT